MKRSFIAISVATIIGLSACSTKVSSSISMNSPISTSVTSEQEFLSNLENASTSQVLQKLKESDGGYTEDCFSVLTNRLIKFPQDTLYVLKYDKLMNDKDFQQLVLSDIKTELPYSGSDEEKIRFISIWNPSPLIKNMDKSHQTFQENKLKTRRNQIGKLNFNLKNQDKRAVLFQSNFRKGGKFKRENKRNVLIINRLFLQA